MFRFKIYREADKGTGSGDSETADAAGINSGDKAKAEPTFTQADIDRILTERLERERKKSDDKAKKAREDAEAKALEDQQKFQELAHQRGTKVAELETSVATMATELETAKGTAERYQKALNTILAEQRKRVPEHLSSLLDKLDPVEQLEWLASNADKLSNTAGVPATPKQKGDMSAADKEKAQKDAERYYRSRF